MGRRNSRNSAVNTNTKERTTEGVDCQGLKWRTRGDNHTAFTEHYSVLVKALADTGGSYQISDNETNKKLKLINGFPTADAAKLAAEADLAAKEAGRAARKSTRTSREGVALATGSDVEIATCLQPKLAATYGEIVFCEDRFWRYDKTRWTVIPRDELWLLATEYDGQPSGKKGNIKLDARHLSSILTIHEKRYSQPGFFDTAAQGVNCRSGFVTFAADGNPSLVPHAAEHRQRDILLGNWHPDNCLDKVQRGSLLYKLLYGSTAGDPEQDAKIEALMRLAGSIVLGAGTSGIAPKVAILKGASKAGKGQLLAMFRGLVPPSAQCSISPSQFADKNFLMELTGKLLNTYDELGSTYAVTSEVFKQVVTGDPVTGCRKYGHPFTFKPQAQHIFACNLLPSFRGGVDKAVLNRLYILQFDRAIPETERIERLGDRIVAEEMDLLLGQAIQGATRLIREGGFPALESSAVELEELADTDSVTAWFKARIIKTPLKVIDSTGIEQPQQLPITKLYADYKEVAETEGHDRKSIVHINVFTARLRSLGLQFKRTNAARFFLGIRFKPKPATEGEAGDPVKRRTPRDAMESERIK